MRTRISAIVALFMLAGALGTAQTQTEPGADAPSKEDVSQFMDLMQVRARMIQITNGMKDGMKAGAEAGLKQQIANPTPEQIARVDALADSVFRDFPLDEMIDAMIPIYQRHLTKTDLDAVIAFYSSPVGQRLLKETPVITSEAMKAGQDIMLKKVPDLTQRLNQEVAKLAKEEMQKTSSAPTNK
jgi:hypothetical protein